MADHGHPDLSAYAGQTIAAIALELSATEKVWRATINRRPGGYRRQDYTPIPPTGLKLLNRFDGTGEVQLGWELGGYDTVKGTTMCTLVTRWLRAVRRAEAYAAN